MFFKAIIILSCLSFDLRVVAERAFEIDFANDRFLKDGKPFRYISGSIHYFRVPSALWRDRLTRARALGLNAIQFYVPWSLHEPRTGNYSFDGDLDFERYLLEAQCLGFVVLLRVGPYICGEFNGGGLPFWLKQLHPRMKVRTKDLNYLHHVDRWWEVLFQKIRPHLYENGGPIIMVQLENEYGNYAFKTNDLSQIEYLTHLRDFARQHLGNKTVFYTVDPASHMRYGTIPDVYPTVDFGPFTDPGKAFAVQRLFAPRGPLINSEFYPGWFDNWGKAHTVQDPVSAARRLDQMLAMGANVNLYMVHGGTSFGFNSGANLHSGTQFQPQTTSYDYDAPISEAGDLTEKFFAIRNVVKKYVTIPDIHVKKTNPKADYGEVILKLKTDVFSLLIRKSTIFGKAEESRDSRDPLTFEELGQDSGYVLYEHILNDTTTDPALLEVSILHDRGYVFVDNTYVGVFCRYAQVKTMPIQIRSGQSLYIFVENQGRVNGDKYMDEDFKGIISSVRVNGHTLHGWKMHSMPLASINGQHLVDENIASDHNKLGFWVGTFKTPCHEHTSNDTFLSTPGWGKGVAFINGFNLGRYWPTVGPQKTLYIPAPFIRPNCLENEIVLFEVEMPGSCISNGKCSVRLLDKPVLNGTVPGWAPLNQGTESKEAGSIDNILNEK